RPGHGDPDEGEPARAEEAIDLSEDGLRVRHMLEGVVEHDEVEGAVEIVDVGPEQPDAGRGLSVGREERVDAGEVREAQIAEVEQEMPRAAPYVEDRVVVPDAGVLQPPDLPGDAEACGQDAAEEVGTVETVGGETALEEDLDAVLARRRLHRVILVRVVGRHVRRRIEDREGAALAAFEVPEPVAQSQHHLAGDELAVVGGIAADGADAPLVRRSIGAVGGRSAIGRRLIGVRGGTASLPCACHRVTCRDRCTEDNNAPRNASGPGPGASPRGGCRASAAGLEFSGISRPTRPDPHMSSISSDTTLIDLEFLGRPFHIATALVEAPGGPVLIDPGPASTLPRLRAALAERGIELRDVRALLLTHIHLDHAGATGVLVRENP